MPNNLERCLVARCVTETEFPTCRVGNRSPSPILSQSAQVLRPIDVLKDPYVLEFLDLPSTPQLREDPLEEAIITRLR